MTKPIGRMIANAAPPLPCMIYTPQGGGPKWELCAHAGMPRRAKGEYYGVQLEALPGGSMGKMEITPSPPGDVSFEVPNEVILWLLGLGPLVPLEAPFDDDNVGEQGPEGG